MPRFSAEEVRKQSEKFGSHGWGVDEDTETKEMLEAFAELLEKLQNMPEWAEACDYKEVLKAAGLKD